MNKRLIIREDDVGYTLAFDLGAMKAIDEGVVTSADVMLDSPHTVEALQWLKERPWISIGWHRHLWESPVLPAEEVPSLVDAEGRFKWRHRHPELKAEATYEDSYKELDAEVRRCIEVYGKAPDTTMFRGDGTELERAMADVVEKYQIHADFSKRIKENHLINLNDPNAKFNLYDLSKFKDYDPAATNILNLVWKNDEDVFMIAGHPGYLDEHILAESSCTIHRPRELQMMMDPRVFNFIIENKIELINSRDLYNGTSEYQDHLKEINSPLWTGNF